MQFQHAGHVDTILPEVLDDIAEVGISEGIAPNDFSGLLEATEKNGKEMAHRVLSHLGHDAWIELVDELAKEAAIRQALLQILGQADLTEIQEESETETE